MLKIQSGGNRELIETHASEIITLSHIDKDKFMLDEEAIPRHSARIILQDTITFLPLEGIIDIQFEKDRITKQYQKVLKNIQDIEKKLNGPFSERAAPEIVQQEREKLEEIKVREKALKEQLEILS